MNANEVFLETGNKLEQKYKPLGFKYLKSQRSLIKRTKEYEYGVSFSSGTGNTKNAVLLCVDLYITYRKLNECLFCIGYLNSTRQLYRIGAAPTPETCTFEQANDDIILQMENTLFPFINKFENNIEDYKQEWIEHGFLGKIDGKFHFSSLLIEITNEKFLGEHNIFGYVTNLRYINEKFGKEAAEKCFKNYYNSLNEKAKIYFEKNFLYKLTGETNGCSDSEKYMKIDVSLILDAIDIFEGCGKETELGFKSRGQILQMFRMNPCSNQAPN